MTNQCNNALGKSLKFMERPNLEHLQKQHHLIASSIKQIATHEKSLDLCIQHQMQAQQAAAGAAGGQQQQTQQPGQQNQQNAANAGSGGPADYSKQSKMDDDVQMG